MRSAKLAKNKSYEGTLSTGTARTVATALPRSQHMAAIDWNLLQVDIRGKD